MKEELNLWLSQKARLPGVLACGLRYPDRTSFNQHWREGFEADPIEKSLACLSDIWRVLSLNNISARWLKWGYTDCWYYAAQRPDGTLLGIIASRAESALDEVAITDLLQIFLAGS